MKRRQRYALNIFSLGLLAFALYLNFVKDEGESMSLPPVINKADSKELNKPFDGTEAISHTPAMTPK